MVGALTDASLALVAFSLLMWVTIPWAFLDSVDKHVKTRLDKATKDRADQTVLNEIYTPKKTITLATNLFFYAGIFFLIQVIVDYLSLVTTFLTYSPIEPIFWIGVGFLAAGVYESNSVIQFLLFPEEIPETGTIFITRMILAGLAVVNIIIFLSVLFPLGNYNILRVVVLISCVLSIIGFQIGFNFQPRIRIRMKTLIPFVIFTGLPLYSLLIISLLITLKVLAL